MTVTGKIQKFLMRQKMTDDLAQGAGGKSQGAMFTNY